MTVTNVREAARAAQAEAFNDEDPNDQRLKEMTLSLYDDVDGMNTQQKSLFVVNALEGIHKAFFGIASGQVENESIARSHAIIGAALTALAGYAVQTWREDEGATSTADIAVTATLQKVVEAARENLMGDATPEEREVAVNVARRVQAGEDLEAVLADETTKAEARGVDMSRFSRAAAPSPGEEDTGHGLYL